MKRVLASLLVLLWPLAFAPKAFATRGGSPDSRLKPLTLKGAGWVSDTEYLLSQNSGDDRATYTEEKKPAAHPVHVRYYTTKKSSQVRTHGQQPRGTSQTAKKGN